MHRLADVERGATLGEGTIVWRFVHVMKGARIGARCVLGQGCFVAAGVVVGDGCHVQNNVSLYEGVTLEDDVFVGPSAVFTNVPKPRAAYPTRHSYVKTLVQTGASIGANATIVCGVRIGRHALVGAGAVVTRDVADHAVVVGNPARARGWICVCGETVRKNAPRRTDRRCPTCNG
ncbi:MAG TPA: acyltransferase [Polyangiaceae bacterium]|nr:acyltransferase [Polyangiaceae bacterium]